MNDTTVSVNDNLASAFRKHLPDLSTPRFVTAKQQTPYEYVQAFREKQSPPWLWSLCKAWEELLEEPFRGVTHDGKVKEQLYEDEDLGIDVQRICDAVGHALAKLTTEQKEAIQYPLNAREWRCWSNPEFLLRPLGLRLEEIPEDAAQSLLGIIEATFSPEGYQKALAAIRINHFLGECCEVPTIMNQYSYNFLLFGQPSADKAWGWSMYGHHLCLNVFLKRGNMFIAPTFTGAEPNLIDSGPWAGTQILHEEGDVGLKLMQSLPPDSQEKALIYKLLHDPQMLQTGDLKVDRWNRDDQRHVCGAFRDNRTVPYEGVKVGSMNAKQQQLVLDLCEHFLLYYPAKARQRRKDSIREHFDETFFCWIGGFADDDTFYFRLQSPVVLLEFDHHSGVFLTNEKPAKFHTHTIVRMPNQGDYGQALREPEERLL